MVEIPNLTDQQWTELVERLTLYADSKLRKLTWRGVPYQRGGQVLGAASGADFAAEAIESVLDGSRKWNKTTEPDFMGFMMNVIDSKVSHLVEREENKQSRRIDTSDREKEPAFYAKGKEKPADQIVANEEQKQRIRTAVIKELDGDEMAESLFDCYEADLTKPQEISELLDVEVKDVNNAKKRLARAADKAFEKLGRSRR